MNAPNPPQSPDPYLEKDADADGSTKAPLLSVVIPVYNEEGILASSIIALRQNLLELGWSFEILIAENGSSDRTVELARELEAKYEQVRAFSIGEPNYGRALKEGILRARGTYIVCDEIDLGDIDFYQRALQRLMDGDAALVVGSKALPSAEDTRPAYRRVATAVCNSTRSMPL